MQIELNFEAGKGNSAEAAIKQLKELAYGIAVEARVDATQYDGPDGAVIVETIVARLNTERKIAISLAYVLACELAEDCVAVRAGYDRRLVGPNAAKWGDFNPDFFIRF